MTARAWAELNAVLAVTEPACDGDDRFTHDDTTDDDALRAVCVACPILAECRAYATYTRGHQIAGYWAGRRRGEREVLAS